MQETEPLDGPHAMPCEEVTGEGADDPHPPLRRTLSQGKRALAIAGPLPSGEGGPKGRVRGHDCIRIRSSERKRLVGQKNNVRLQREHIFELESRIASAVTEQVASADALDEIRYVRVAAAPHPRLFPDGDHEGKIRSPFAVGRELLNQ